MLNNLMGIAGACLMGFCKYPNSYEMLIIGRFIIGFYCGIYLIFFFSLVLIFSSSCMITSSSTLDGIYLIFLFF